LEFLVNLAVGLIGALVGGLLAWRIEIRRRRVEVTLNLFGEFNTHEMIKIRHLAADKADKDPDLDFRQLRERDGRLAMKEIWVVQNYFQRLWPLVKHNQVDRELVPDLFGDRLAWWVYHHYEKSCSTWTTLTRKTSRHCGSGCRHRRRRRIRRHGGRRPDSLTRTPCTC
jgi:hypothetical protein